MQSHPRGGETQSLPGSLAPGLLCSETPSGFMSPWLCQCPIPPVVLSPTVRLSRVSWCRRRVADVSASRHKGNSRLRIAVTVRLEDIKCSGVVASACGSPSPVLSSIVTHLRLASRPSSYSCSSLAFDSCLLHIVKLCSFLSVCFIFSREH